MEQITLTLPPSPSRDLQWLRSLTPEETGRLIDALQVLRDVNAGASAAALAIRIEHERRGFQLALETAGEEKRAAKVALVECLVAYAKARGRMPRRRLRLDGLSESVATLVENDADLWDSAVTEAKRQRRAKPCV